jgi:hypothetical protein
MVVLLPLTQEAVVSILALHIVLVRGRLRSVGRLDEMISRAILWFEVAIAGAPLASLPGERLTSSGPERLVRVPDVPA